MITDNLPDLLVYHALRQMECNDIPLYNEGVLHFEIELDCAEIFSMSKKNPNFSFAEQLTGTSEAFRSEINSRNCIYYFQVINPSICDAVKACLNFSPGASQYTKNKTVNPEKPGILYLSSAPQDVLNNILQHLYPVEPSDFSLHLLNWGHTIELKVIIHLYCLDKSKVHLAKTIEKRLRKALCPAILTD